MREDAAGTANQCGCCATAMIWCKPQHTRGHSFTNTALEDMQGVLCKPIPELRPALSAIYPAEGPVAE